MDSASADKGKPRQIPWWEKPLGALDRAQWEALCDGCGRCCLNKLEDDDTGQLFATNVACRLLDRNSARCTDYKRRKQFVTDCVVLNRDRLEELEWLPSTCAYRLRAEGRALHDWHYLISGDRETVHAAGQSTRGWTVSEVDAGELEHHIVDRPCEVVAGVPLAIRIHPRARRLKLRLDDNRGALILTVPPRTSRRTALAWAAKQANWVEAQMELRSAPSPLASGAVIPFEGREVSLEWREGESRAVTLRDDTLVCGGPGESFASRIQSWLMRRARERLSAETALAGARAGVTVRSVSIGDAGTRWGSCSSHGAIRYNWRLILMPQAALRFVVAHEVAHRLHMDHGAAFKATEARLYDGDVADARLLLRDFGPLVRRVGRIG